LKWAGSARSLRRSVYLGYFSRVLRGGSWNNNTPTNVRAANRNRNLPSNRNNNVGFRCAKTVIPQ